MAIPQINLFTVISFWGNLYVSRVRLDHAVPSDALPQSKEYSAYDMPYACIMHLYLS